MTNEYEDLDMYVDQAAAEMDIHRPGEVDFEQYSAVYNERFTNCPALVVMCSEISHIQFWVCVANKLRHYPIQVRSGGHHHEAMCVEKGAITLDLSRMPNEIEFEDNKNFAWIPSARRLGSVVDDLMCEQKMLPVGGCETVNVGGLTHGGGWGASYRKYGLTADMLDRVEMVLTNGQPVIVGKNGWIDCEPGDGIDGDGEELFWALRGGGGGNFGIVTRFRFRMTAIEPMCGFTLHFDKADRAKVVRKWIDLCNSGDDGLTSFCRLTVVNSDEYNRNNPAVIIGGRFYGDEDGCIAELANLLSDPEPKCKIFNPSKISRAMFLLNESSDLEFADGTSMPPRAYALNIGAYTTGTCTNYKEDVIPQPHKVSSMFPTDDGSKAIEVIDCVMGNKMSENGAAYISLHGMGGRNAKETGEDTAFSWRDCDFMMQIQAWWKCDTEDGTEYLDWVENFRKQLVNHPDGGVTGAFVNFPDDKNKVSDFYSDGDYCRLLAAKKAYDPNKVMRFRLGLVGR